MKLVEQMDTVQVVEGNEVAVRTLRLDPTGWERITAIGRPARFAPGELRVRQQHSHEWTFEEHLEIAVAGYQSSEIVRVWYMVILEDPEEIITHTELAGDNWTIESFVVQGEKAGAILVG